MAFKMKGSPAKMGRISGTAGHGSALKMKAGSALKAKNPKAKTYDEAYDAMNERNRIVDESGRKDFKKAAKDYNMKTYGTTNPTKAANAANMTKKEYAAKYKANKTKADSKTTTATKGDNKGKTVVTGLGAKNSKTLTTTQKATEKVKIDAANTKIKKGKTTNDKNVRDEGQLEKGEIKSGRDNAKTGTMLSRALGRLKVKRNKRQLEKRAKKNEKDTPAKMYGKSMAKKALVGNQKNLPEHLKAKIDAAPGKMYGKSMAKKYKK